MIILILLILLSNYKGPSKPYPNNYLFLLLILPLLFYNDNYNPNVNIFKSEYKPTNPSNNSFHYNSHKGCNNCTPYNKDDYLKNYNKAPAWEPSNKNNTHSSNKCYPKKQFNNNVLNSNYDKSNSEQCISILTNDKTNSIDTISSKNSHKSKEKNNQFNILNEQSLIKPTSNPTTINSITNKNINKNKPIILNNKKKKPTTNNIINTSDNSILRTNDANIINTNTDSLDSMNKFAIKTPINIDNTLQGQVITIVLEGFGSITGTLLSNHDNVISLKLKNNLTIFINENFISYFY